VSGIALVVAIYSALKRLPVQAGLVILGDLSIQGNIKAMRSLAEPLQVAMDNGARKYPARDQEELPTQIVGRCQRTSPRVKITQK
jgi:predicted ATP-dependent Lon-type protease